MQITITNDDGEIIDHMYVGPDEAEPFGRDDSLYAKIVGALDTVCVLAMDEDEYNELTTN